MSSIEVQVEADSLRLRNNEVTGRIHVRLDDEAFPEQDWDDFVVVILDWWCRALMTDQKRTELGFMDGPDGPFRAELTRETAAESEVKLLGRRQDKVLTGRVSHTMLARSVVAASDRVLATCRQRGWTTSDIDRLEGARAALAERVS